MATTSRLAADQQPDRSASLLAFIARWQRSTLSERAGAQQHFIDLCRALGQQPPGEADPTSRSVQRNDAAALIAAGNTLVQDPAQVWGSP